METLKPPVVMSCLMTIYKGTSHFVGITKITMIADNSRLYQVLN